MMAKQPFPYSLDDLFLREIYQRLSGWMRARWLTMALLFAVAVFYRPSLGLPYPIIPILTLIMLSLIFNCIMYFLLLRREQLSRFWSAQVAMDLFIITAVIQTTGGIVSPFQWFYLFVIIATGMVAGLKYSLGVAAISTFLYGLILWGQYHLFIPHIPVGNIATYSLSSFRDPSILIANFVLNGGMFIGLGGLGGYVAETAEERKKQLAAADRFYHWSMLRSTTMAQEKERKRISRDLHDELGQSLTAILFNLQALEFESLEKLPAARARAKNLQDLLQDSLDSLHKAIADLRPPILDDLGLVSSVKWYTDMIIKPLGIAVSVIVSGQPVRLEEAVEITLYRVFQETLTNVVKHAQAHEIIIILRFDSEEVAMIVQDDGVGFSVQNSVHNETTGWGIPGMKERVAIVNGKLNITSAPGKGTTLSIHVPHSMCASVKISDIV